MPLTSSSLADASAALPTPPLRRRLACLMYEGVLLFGVMFFSALIYSVVTHQRHAMTGRYGMLLVAFVAAPGLYCIWYWSQTGQTLPMQTWQIRVVTAASGERLSRPRALARYLAAWVWFLPALVVAWAAGWHQSGTKVSLAVVTGVVGYALLSRLHPRRQFWHDALCGTRLVDTRDRPEAP